jgi:WD40 repeat protein
MALVLRFLRPAVSLLVLGSVLGAPARAQTGEPILRIETGTHTAQMNAAGADAAGRLLVTASGDKTARIWALPDLRPLGVLRPPIGSDNDGKLYAVAVSPDGRLAAVGGWLGHSGDVKSVLLFDLRSHEIVRRWSGLLDIAVSLAFSADGARLAAGLASAGILVWSVADGKEAFADGLYLGPVRGLSFAPDGNLVAASRLLMGDRDGIVRLYDTTGKLLRQVTTEAGQQPSRAAFSPDGTKLAIVFDDEAPAVELRDGHTLALIGRPEVERTQDLRLARVAWSRDGTRLFAAGDAWRGTGTVLVWSAGGHGPRQIIAQPGFSNAAGDIIPLADGAIVTTSLSGDIALTGSEGTRRATVTPIAADFRTAIDRSDATRQLLVAPEGVRVAWTQARAHGRWDVADAVGFDIAAATYPPTGLAPSSASDGRVSVTDWDQRPDPKLNGRALELAPSERALSVAVRDGRVLLGGDYLLRLFDRTGQQIWQHPIPDAAWRVNQSSDGRLAVAALGDGTVRWYRLRDGQELLALFLTSDAKRWVAFTPSGYYDASPGGEDLIGWHINRGPDQAADFFPASRFHDRMYRPDVVRLVLDTLDENAAVTQANVASGRVEPKITLADIATLAPPTLELISAPTRFATDHVSIKFSVHAPVGAPMMGDPRIKVNGAWQPTSRAVSQVAADDTRQVVIGQLPSHDSMVEIYGDNQYARSEPLTIRLQWDSKAAVAPGQQGRAAQHMPRLFILAVGISQYQRPDLRLNFAADDAERFVGAMRAQRGKLYAEVTTKLLRDDEATLAGVKTGLAWLQNQATGDDVGILFLAGHGFQSPDKDYFYAPADFDPSRPRDTGIDYKTIRQTLVKFSGAGNKAIFLIDTCYAGGALGPNLGASSADSFATQLSRPEYNVVVLTASSGDQLSYEDAKWGDGAFTKALLEGVTEGKADPAQTGEITVFDLSSYVTKRVKVLTEQRQIPRLLMPSGGVEDFAIATH